MDIDVGNGCYALGCESFLGGVILVFDRIVDMNRECPKPEWDGISDQIISKKGAYCVCTS